MAGRLAGIRTIGAKRQARLLRELGRFRERIARRRLGDVLPIAERLIAHVQAAPGVHTVQYAGSLRRGRETIGDLDILTASDDPGPVMEHFIASSDVEEVVGTGGTKTSVLVGGGFQVDLLVVAPDEFGAALAYFTGSKEHNIEIRARAQQRGLSLNERGFLDAETDQRRPAATEQDVYAAVGLPWIDPALRENRGEIEAAEAGTLPSLIELGDIRGELHGHSLWSDGAASISNMVVAARRRGLEYFAVTDHSGALLVANGLTPERLAEQTDEIARERAASPDVRLLHGSEVEILADGSLDFSDEILASLDVVVASVHSNFNQPQVQMTERLIAAIENPHVDIIGHPNRTHAGSARRVHVRRRSRAEGRRRHRNRAGDQCCPRTPGPGRHDRPAGRRARRTDLDQQRRPPSRQPGLHALRRPDGPPGLAARWGRAKHAAAGRVAGVAGPAQAAALEARGLAFDDRISQNAQRSSQPARRTEQSPA